MELTILTPTYNREVQLKDLFESLQKQTVKSFEWLIVDDGSSDTTKNTIENFTRRSAFPIKYVYKNNGGKHTALNVGIKLITSDLVFIVDSDDILTDGAVETILTYHKKYKGYDGLCGYSFLRMYPDGKINGKLFPKNEWIASLIESRINSDDASSDKAEVYYTDILKQYPFPEYEGEKFLGEDIVWIRIAKKFKMVHINEAIYIGAYLQEGLTNNRRKHNIESPVGCMNRAKEFMSSDIKMKYRLKGALQYIIYGKFAKQSFTSLMKNTPNKSLTLCAIIPGVLLYYLWRRSFNLKQR